MGIQPEGEAVRKAVKYISARRGESPQPDLKSLIQQACLKFDLAPKDADFLCAFYEEQEK